MVNPALLAPIREWLRGVDAKAIQFWITPFRAQLGVLKPISGELGKAIGHVLSAENSKLKHLLWAQGWLKVLVKILPLWFAENVTIVRLHEIVHEDGSVERRHSLKLL